VLEISVLGPVEVRRDGHPVAVPGGKTAELLVRLALDAGTTVSADRLVDDLWAGASTRRNTLQAKVARLRRAVPEAIEGTYRLGVEPDQVDALCVLRDAAAGAKRLDGGDEHGARELSTAALERFRGELLPAAGDWAAPHRSQLEEARAKLIETQLTARMRLGEHVIADAEAAAQRRPKQPIAPWDYRYYAEKVRKARYDLDENEVKPYLQLERLREAMFWVAGELFGFDFVPVAGLPVVHPDVRVWEVVERDSRRHVGLWYFDPYARQGKRSGAWMNAYRNQERFACDIPTIVSNNANFVEGEPGVPILVSWTDAETMFHEFGHALHGLASDVRYPSLSGTSVVRDYVEFPSQLLEHWLSTPEVLEQFALHHETGEPIPPPLVAKIEQAAKFNQGFKTAEYLASALVDMKLHLAGDRDIDPRRFERATLAEIGMPREIVMRHRTPQFGHIFSGDGYSAAYYSYLWADTLSADAWEAFSEAPGGAYDRDVAQRLYDHVFSRGNTVDPELAYRAFRGRDPGTAALMRQRGFPITEEA